jgi:putative heme iron utilization protein
MNNAAEARRFARGQHAGVLSTLSQRIDNFPFGSVAPFILDPAGRPVILISTLAEHTKNLIADPRCSLIVQPFNPDMQVVGRVTVIGRARPLDEKDSLGPRYLRYHPQAEGYLAMHDFNFYRIEPLQIRWIGGFGKIHWVDGSDYVCATGSLAEEEAEIVAHMNRDHVDSMLNYCRHVHGVEATRVEMIGIDPDGFDLRADERMLRFDFAAQVLNAREARLALVELAAAARPL